MTTACHDFTGLDTAAKSSEQHKLQPVLRLRPSCAGITFEGRVDFAMEEKEQWKSVVGYEGIYEASDAGRVRTDERAGAVHKRYRPGKILKSNKAQNGYLHTHLNREGKKLPTIHSLVLMAFVGPRPIGSLVRRCREYPWVIFPKIQILRQGLTL